MNTIDEEIRAAIAATERDDQTEAIRLFMSVADRLGGGREQASTDALAELAHTCASAEVILGDSCVSRPSDRSSPAAAAS